MAVVNIRDPRESAAVSTSLAYRYRYTFPTIIQFSQLKFLFLIFNQPPNVDMDFISQTLPNCSDGLFWGFQHLLPPCQLVNCNCGHDWKSHNHPCQWNNWICKVTQPFLRLPLKWPIFNFVYLGSRFPVEFQRARPYTEFILLWE